MGFGKKGLLFVFASLLLLASGVHSYPVGWGEDVQLTQYNMPVQNDEPLVVTDSEGFLHIVWLDRNGTGKLYYTKVNDAGVKLIQDTVIANGNLPLNYDNSASLSIDSFDNLHIIWADSRNAQSQLFYRKMDTFGNILIADKNITTSSWSAREPDLVFDSPNTFFLTWYSAPVGNSYPDVFFRKFDSDGNPFFEERMISVSDTAKQPAIDVDSSGNIHIVFADRPSVVTPSHNISHRKISSNGTFLSNVTILIPSGWNDTYSNPDLVIDSHDNLIVSYYAQVNANTSPGIKRFNSNLISIGFAGNMNPPIASVWYQLIEGASDNIYLVWYSLAQSPSTHIYYGRIADGNVLVPASQLTDNLHTTAAWKPNGTLTKEGNPLIVWIDARDGSQEIFMKKAKPAPVLLVHGIYSSDEIWDEAESKLWQAGFTPYRIGALVNQQGYSKPGMHPNNGDIQQLKNQLKSAIQKIKLETGQSVVDVVAHSMGGLVARAYISSNDYAGDINNLIMLGTPNAGSAMARHHWSGLLSHYVGEEPTDPARFQMVPDSPFLNILNRDYDKKNVNHVAIAGTALFAPLVRIPFCALEPRFCFPIFGHIQNDMIVPVSSAGFLTDNCYVDDVAHIKIGNTVTDHSYYTDPNTINQIISLLRDGTTNLSDCPASFLPPAVENNVEIKLKTNTILPGQIQNADTIEFPQKFFVSGAFFPVSGMAAELVAPTGSVINSSNFQVYPGVQYISTFDGNTRYAEYTVTNPEINFVPQGNWTLRVGNNIGNGITDYNTAVFIGRKVGTQTATNQVSYLPGDTIILSTNIRDANANVPVVNANIAATIEKPDAGLSYLTLYDDGNHSDANPSDGIYANTYLPPLAGMYIFDVNASGIYQTIPFVLREKTSAAVVVAPDLQLDHQRLTVTPTAPLAGQRAFVQADIRNIGNAQATHASIEFWDGEPANGGVKFYQKSVNVPVGQTVQIKTRWNPTSGTHNIVVFPSSFNPFLDANYANDKVSKTVVVP